VAPLLTIRAANFISRRWVITIWRLCFSIY